MDPARLPRCFTPLMYGRAEVIRMRGMAAHIERAAYISQDSLPPTPTVRHKRSQLAGLAQLVEQRFCKAKVAGSNPAAGANSPLVSPECER